MVRLNIRRGVDDIVATFRHCKAKKAFFKMDETKLLY